MARIELINKYLDILYQYRVSRSGWREAAARLPMVTWYLASIESRAEGGTYLIGVSVAKEFAMKTIVL